MSREAFEEWAANNDKWEYDLSKLPFGHYADNKTAHACAGYQARQPEIDALKEELEGKKRVIATMHGVEKILREDGEKQFEELTALKAEVERLKAAPTPEVEPVGWMYVDSSEPAHKLYPLLVRDRLPDAMKRNETWKECPLYTRPASDELVKAVEQTIGTLVLLANTHYASTEVRDVVMSQVTDLRDALDKVKS